MTYFPVGSFKYCFLNDCIKLAVGGSAATPRWVCGDPTVGPFNPRRSVVMETETTFLAIKVVTTNSHPFLLDVEIAALCSATIHMNNNYNNSKNALQPIKAYVKRSTSVHLHEYM